MNRLLVLMVLTLLAACGQGGPFAGNAPLRVVQEAFAKVLNLKSEDIAPDKTLEQLGADDLDLVEAVMEIEDRLKIQIPDAAIDKAAGIDKPDQLLKKLTIARLAEVVAASQKPQ